MLQTQHIHYPTMHHDASAYVCTAYTSPNGTKLLLLKNGLRSQKKVYLKCSKREIARRKSSQAEREMRKGKW